MSKAKLSASEWELVKDAPYWINAALAAADGRVAIITSRREAKALSQAIRGYQSSNTLIKDIVADESDPAKEIKNATQSSAEKALSQIAAVVEKKLGAGDLNALNDFLLQVGQAIAASAGEGVLGLGDKVSKKEAAALEGIAEALKATDAHKQERRQANQLQAQAQRQAAARADADAKAEAEVRAAAEAKAEADARAREEAAKTKAAAEIQAKMEAEQAKREAEQKARQDALAQEKAAREAEARAAADARAVEAAAAEAAAAEAAAAPQFIAEHTVASGDNLSMISQKYYGTQVNWRAIYEANKETIGDNPSLIRPGQHLRIPKL